MTQPNFAEMSLAELRVYVLEHQEDQEAFYVLADRFYAHPNKKSLNLDEIDQLPEVMRARQKHKDQ